MVNPHVQLIPKEHQSTVPKQRHMKMMVRYYSPMRSPASDLRAEVATAVDEYQAHGNPAHLRARLRDLAGSATPDALIAAVEPFREIPEVAAPVYEQVVKDQPDNARAL